MNGTLFHRAGAPPVPHPASAPGAPPAPHQADALVAPHRPTHTVGAGPAASVRRLVGALGLLAAVLVTAAALAAGGAAAYLNSATEPATSTLRVVGITYELAYDANGGDAGSVPAAQSATTFERSHAFTVAADAPSRDGFRFVSWADTPDGTLAHRAGTTVELTADAPRKTLYAVWSDSATLAPGKVVSSRMKDPTAVGISSLYDRNDSTVKSVTFGATAEHAAAVAGVTGSPVAVEDDFDLALADSTKYTAEYPYSDAIMLYRVPNGGGFDIYVLSDWKVYANQRSDYLFNFLNYAETIGPLTFDTSRVQTMESMFHACWWAEFDVSGFDTSQVINMKNMLNNCQSLAAVDLSSFDTSRVTTFAGMFSNCSSLRELDVTMFDTGAATDMSEMFSRLSLRDLDLSRFNTGNVTTMKDMFSMSSYRNLDLTAFDTSKVATMEQMFMSCNALQSVDLSSFDTRSLTTAYRMFENCSALLSLDVTNFNTSNVVNMADMFYNCAKLTSLDVSNFDTSNVSNMYMMFGSLKKVTALDLGNFDTSKVTGMSSMFASNGALVDLNVTSFDTSRVTSMTSMFAGCTSLEELDLSSFDTARVTDMGSMLKGCPALRTVRAGSGWSTARVTSSATMFTDSTAIVGGAGTAYDAAHVDASYARIDGGPDAPGYLTGTNSATAASIPEAGDPLDLGEPDPLDVPPAVDDERGREGGSAVGETPESGIAGAPADDARPAETEPGPAEADAGDEAAADPVPQPAMRPATDPIPQPAMRPAAFQTGPIRHVAAFAAPSAESSVTFDGNAQRFVFAPGSASAPDDLFPNLKSAMPGDTLTQRIVVRNDADGAEAVDLYLQSLGAQEGTEAFLSQLALDVTQESGEPLASGPAHEAGSLAGWTHLGTLAPGDEATLLLTLEVPLSLGDAYQNARGAIEWEFRADEATANPEPGVTPPTPSPTPGTNPIASASGAGGTGGLSGSGAAARLAGHRTYPAKTGDGFALGAAALVAIAAAAAGTVAYAAHKRKRR